MTEKIHAYSYLRISTLQQRMGDGIRRQLESSKKYAETMGYELIEEMSDVGVSAFKGKNSKEGALGVFLSAINSGEVRAGSVLIVESLDRLSRQNVLEAFAQFTAILNMGVGIVTLADNQHYTKEGVAQNVGQLFTSIGVMVRANEESEIKSKRIGAAWQKKRNNIRTSVMTRNLPAWLETDEGRSKITINRPKADIVEMIFDLSINGMGIFSLTRHLNDDLRKYPTISDADRWNMSYITKILNNPAVHGEYQPMIKVDGKRIISGEAVEDYFPAIISRDKYNLAQSRMAGRKLDGSGRKGDGLSNLFSGLLKCGTCHGTVMMRSKGNPPKGFKYLRCENSLHGANCSCPSWRYEEFESSFITFVREVSFTDILSGTDTTQRLTSLHAQAATKAVNIQKLNEAYQTLLTRFEDPTIPEAVIASLSKRSVEIASELEVERTSLQAINEQISELSNENIEASQSDFLSKYDELLKSKDENAIREARYSMSGLLRRTVESIVVMNQFELEPYEIPEMVSDRLLRELGDAGFNTEKKLQDYLLKPVGARRYTASERSYVVKFRNGTSRIVKPYDQNSYQSVSEKLVELRKKKVQ
jgi:DNA invertase Pin-like site-specific DNA recombinase